MEEDFDALIAELESASPVQPRQPQGAVSDELDALMSQLGSPSPSASASAAAPRAPHAAPSREADELDALMSQLGSPAPVPAAAQSPVRPSAQAPRQAAPADELDALMSQLGSPAPSQSPNRPSARAPAAAQAAPADELDALMNQLGSPAPTPAPAPAAAHSPVRPSAQAPRPPNYEDELAALLGQVGGAQPAPAPPGRAGAAVHVAKPAGPVDDLDALMNQLTVQTPSPASTQTRQPPTMLSKDSGDELDALMSQLGSPAPSPAQATRPPPATAPVDDLDSLMAQLSSPAPSQPQVQRSGSSAAVSDDLDALMNSLTSSPSPTTISSPQSAGRGAGFAAQSSASSRGVAPSSPGMTGAAGRGAAGRGVAPGSPTMAGVPGGAPGGRGRGGGGGRGELDSLLSSLNNQMSNINDGNTGSRGICAFCNKHILGDCMQALGRTYHPEHFVCSSCQEPLGTKPFYESDSQPTCEVCYKNMMCPKCAYCNQAIPDRCVNAMNRKWHVECFVCNQCVQPFPGGEFFEKGGMPYCRNCLSGTFGTKCAGCGQVAMGAQVVNAMGQQWHATCFACDYCRRPLSNQPFFPRDGKVFCQQHYHAGNVNTTCFVCKLPITGPCTDALGKRYHPQCFVCAYCMNPLSGGGYTEKHGSAYCHECTRNLF